MDDLRVDALGPGDLEAAQRLSAQAGWNQNAADWARLLELFPNGCFAGRRGERLVATATVADYAPGLRWIGMVLVDEAERGKGYGKRMLDRALEHSLAGVALAVGLDATDLGRPLYQRFGFADAWPIDRWEGALPASSPEPDPRALELESVIVFDGAACGADRGAFLRRLTGEPGVSAWMIRSSYGIEGYAILRPGRRAHHLGPVVAATPRALRAILAAAGRILAGRPVIVDVPRRAELAGLLSELGLEVRRSLWRMTHRDPRPLLLGPKVLAIAGFEWG